MSGGHPPAEPLLDLTLDSAWHGARPVLGAMQVQLHKAEVLALCGPSGVGKSTFLRIVAGLHSGWKGRRVMRGRLAMVFQEPTLLPWRNALDNISLAAGCSTATAQTALADVGLGDRADAFPGTLSLGQQRRLALARAIAARPDLLLMDEPFVSLDAALVEDMLTLIETLKARHGFAAILVTHAESEAERLADRILRLSGRPAQIAA